MAIRLVRGGAYAADINALRNQIRANGTRNGCVPITVTYQDAMNRSIDLYVNLAYQANGNLQAPNASLYITAFRNVNGTYIFNTINPFPCLGLVGISVNIDASYRSLGYPFNLPKITNTNLMQSIITLTNYNGGPLRQGNNGESDAIARLAIAVSEAARFESVRQGIDSVLASNNANPYQPDAQKICAWGGHTLG